MGMESTRPGLVRNYTDLEVYCRAFDAAMQVFQLSKGFPRHETYSLTDQVRRSSRSVCANLAEAWRKRRYEAAFVAKLSDAETEAAETLVWLQFAVECGYWSVEAATPLRQEFDHIIGMLVRMARGAKTWILK